MRGMQALRRAYRGRALRLLGAAAGAMVVSALPPSVGQARAEDPRPQISPSFVLGFDALHQQLGPAMGAPLEDEHPDGADAQVQRTTTGLAVWREGEAPSFTDGWHTWRLERPGGEQALASVSPAATGPPSPPPGVWDRLASCESTGQWNIRGGTYSGGLQFDRQTWAAYGGLAYAPTAGQASRAAQIAVAQRLQAARGWQPWPVCSRVVGLR